MIKKRTDVLNVSLGQDKPRHKKNLQLLAKAVGIPRNSIGGLMTQLSIAFETYPDYTIGKVEEIIFPTHRTVNK